MDRRDQNYRTRFFETAVAASLALLFFVSVERVDAATINWNGPASGYWTSSTNWDSGTVPTSADDVTIASTTDSFGPTVNIPMGTIAQFNSLTIATGSLDIYGQINGGSLTTVGNTNITQYTNLQQYLSGNMNLVGGSFRQGFSSFPSTSYALFFRADNIFSTNTSFIASGRGYGGSFNPGDNGFGPGGGLGSAMAGGGGAGFAGVGGDGAGSTGSGGASYCNDTWPSAGSAGGAGSSGTSGGGGGLIMFQAKRTSTFSGATFFNDGSSGSGASGGGSGGGYLFFAKDLRLAGNNLNTHGGDGGSSGGGGGAGGCIIMRYRTTFIGPFTPVGGGLGGGGGADGSNGSVLGGQIPVFPVLVPTSTDQITSNSVRYNWVPGEGGETSYKLDASFDGVNFTNIAMPAAPSSSYTFSGLTPAARYWFRVASYDGVSTSPYMTSSRVYTLPNQGAAPLIVGVTGGTVQLQFVADGNATSALYAVYVSSTNKYVTAAGALTNTPTYFSSSSWTGSVTGLTPSTSYSFAVIARNGDGINAATSSYSSTSTLAPIVPSTPTSTPSNPTTSSIKITIGSDGNSVSTTYAIFNQTTGFFATASGTPTSTPSFFSSSTWNNGFFTGLNLNTAYQFVLVAKSIDDIYASSSVTSPLYTLALQAAAPTVTTAGTSSLNLVINGNGNPSNTQYAIYNASTTQYVLSTGGPTTSPVFYTSSSWSGTVTGLSINTGYQLLVIARNGNGIDAPSSTANSVAYTLVNPAAAPSLDTPTVGTLHVVLNADNNPTNTEYAVYNVTNGTYVGTGGVPSATAVFYTSSTWGAITASGLLSNTPYQFSVIARNSGSVNAATSTPSTALSTLAFFPVRPNAPTLANPTVSSIRVTINTNGNSPTTTYSILNVTTGNYVSSAGGPTTTPDYFTSTTWNNSFATGLSLNTSYQFVVTAKSIDGFTSSSPTSTALYTLANPALAPTVSSTGTSTLSLIINTNSNPANTLYAVFNSSTGQYVSATGTASMAALYFTSSTWGGMVNGLAINSPYQFFVVARNGDNVDAASSSLSTAAYTLSNPASPVTATSTGTSTVVLQFGTNGNPTSTTYSIYNATIAAFLDASGSPTATPVYQASSSWGTAVSSTGLNPNTAYQFGVVAKNGSGAASPTSTSNQVYTLATLPTGLTTTAKTPSSVTLAWSGNGSQYYIENMTSAMNSGWVSSTSFTFTGLSCNGGYEFRVKARNGDAIETAFTTKTMQMTDVCVGTTGGGIVGVPAGGGGGVYGGGSSYVTSTPTTSTLPTSTAPTSTVPTSTQPTSSTVASSGLLTIDQLFPGFGSGLAPFIPDEKPLVTLPTISFFNKPVTPVRVGTSFAFRYTVTNTTTVSRAVRVERTLLNARGTVITRTSALISQRSGQVFTSLPRVTLSTALPVGTYTVRVRVLTTTGRVIAQDSFSVTARR